MSRLARTVTRLERYPRRVLSWAIGRTVRLIGTAGVQFESMTPEAVTASLANKPKVRNHIGQVHAAGMYLLAETVTGMLVGMNIPDDKIPLLKSAQVRYVRRSEGAIRATATITEDQRQIIQQTDKGEVNVPFSLTDATGEVPMEGEMIWAWILKKKKS